MFSWRGQPCLVGWFLALAILYKPWELLVLAENCFRKWRLIKFLPRKLAAEALKNALPSDRRFQLNKLSLISFISGGTKTTVNHREGVFNCSDRNRFLHRSIQLHHTLWVTCCLRLSHSHWYNLRYQYLVCTLKVSESSSVQKKVCLLYQVSMHNVENQDIYKSINDWMHWCMKRPLGHEKWQHSCRGDS